MTDFSWWFTVPSTRRTRYGFDAVMNRIEKERVAVARMGLLLVIDNNHNSYSTASLTGREVVLYGVSGAVLTVPRGAIYYNGDYLWLATV